jgi:dihydrofolate synthase / folylpolyglutamate synthase
VTPSHGAVLERLYGLAPRGALLGLERVRAAVATFGHPERRFASLHVAGTNGKGSVSAMTAAMALEAGARAGLYTSPHLSRFNERVQVDGKPVDDDLLFPALEEVMNRCPELTFFETATVAAFHLFARLGVELAVVEVGLGGRLDATNVVVPMATAITKVALDHTDRLGSTLTAIAHEKAGIAKPGVPLIVGSLAPEALAEVSRSAEAVGAPMKFADRDPLLDAFVERHPPALAGAHQRDNAKIAVLLGREAQFSDRAIAGGLRRVEWHGRLETIRSASGEVLLDAAHNADGAAAVARALAERSLSPARVALVFGAMADKDYATMLAALAPFAEHRVFVAPEGRRAADPAAMALLYPGVVAETAERALAIGRKSVGPEGLVLVTGSIFLVGAARSILLGLPRDPAVAL